MWNSEVGRHRTVRGHLFRKSMTSVLFKSQNNQCQVFFVNYCVTSAENKEAQAILAEIAAK